MPTTLPTGGLPLDRRPQVVGVVALEEPLAQRVERLPARHRVAGLEPRVPLRAQLLQLTLVLVPFPVDRLTRGGQAVAQVRGGRASLALFPDFVELFVQGEHFLE